MRLTKYGHACVRLDTDGGSVVLDPGTYSPDVDLDGVADVLVTHEHADHLDADRLVPAVRAGLRLHTNAAVAAFLAAEHGIEVHAVGAGGDLRGGRRWRCGSSAATMPRSTTACPAARTSASSSPGSTTRATPLHVPDVDVETLLLPVSAPWLKLAEAIDFVRAVAPARAFPVHDAMLSDIGAAGVDRWMELKGGTDYRRLAPGGGTDL